MSKRALGIATIVAAIGTTASAGQKLSVPVTVDTSALHASGAVGTARNSVDTTQYILCEVYLSGSTSYLYCWARDAADHFASCFSSSPYLIQVAQAISGDSSIYFTYSSTGVCSGLSVYNSSLFEPKQ